MVAQESTAEKDEEIIISIVKEMTESMAGAQSTRHWAKDALWLDIPNFESMPHELGLGNPIGSAGSRRGGEWAPVKNLYKNAALDF